MSRPIWTANLSAPANPERNRLIVALKATTALTFAEIGGRAGCSRNAVAGVVDRARRAGRLPAISKTEHPSDGPLSCPCPDGAGPGQTLDRASIPNGWDRRAPGLRNLCWAADRRAPRSRPDGGRA